MANGTENEAAIWIGKAWDGLIAADPAWVGVWVAVGIFLFGGVWFVVKLLFQGRKKGGVRTTGAAGGGNTVNQPGRDQTTAGTVIHGFTPEQFEEQLARRTEHLTAQIKDLYRRQAELMARRNGGNEQPLADIAEALRLAEAGRAYAEAKRADLENAYKAQVEELERLKAELRALQEDAPGIDGERLQSALAALDENRTASLRIVSTMPPPRITSSAPPNWRQRMRTICSRRNRSPTKPAITRSVFAMLRICWSWRNEMARTRLPMPARRMKSPPTSTLKAVMPRPSRSSAKAWRYASACLGRTIPQPPPAITMSPPT